MTREELKSYLEDERAEIAYCHRKAEAEFNGNQMWYEKGRLDIIDQILEKLIP